MRLNMLQGTWFAAIFGGVLIAVFFVLAVWAGWRNRLAETTSPWPMLLFYAAILTAAIVAAWFSL